MVSGVGSARYRVFLCGNVVADFFFGGRASGMYDRARLLRVEATV